MSKRKSKYLSYLLRHDKKAYERGKIDRHGWRMVSEIIELGITPQQLDEIVATNDKQRFEYSEDKLKIRARQGHSIEVDVELKEMTPPDILYHGTSTKSVVSIIKNGIVSGSRLYVHLSVDEATAIKVGSRHGIPYVFKINCKKMVEDGYKFWISNNGIWLTKIVLPKYII
jgi:putative RNA 2'-phosphotransferase